MTTPSPHRTWLFVLAIALTCGGLPDRARAGSGGDAEGRGGWLVDMEAAIKLATDEKKDLLLDFTGSDWCIWCIRLKQEVFDTEAFRKEAPKHFVLVELDFPRDFSKMSEQTRKQNQAWLEKLGVQGFPTIFLTDSTGKPYAKTGYQAGGPQKYLDHLQELLAAGRKLQASLKAASTASGRRKAELLDTALGAVDESLALAAYREVMREIIALDPENRAGLRDRYQEQVDFGEAQRVVAEIREQFSGDNLDAMLRALAEAEKKHGRWAKARVALGLFKVELLRSQDKTREASAEIDELLRLEGIDPLQKLDVTLQKIGLVREQGRTEEVVPLLEGLIADRALTPEIRTQLEAQKARALVELGKLEEGLTTLERVLAGEKDPEVLYRLHVTRGELLAKAGRKKEAADAFDAAVELVEDKNVREQIQRYRDQLLQTDS